MIKHKFVIIFFHFLLKYKKRANETVLVRQCQHGERVQAEPKSSDGVHTAVKHTSLKMVFSKEFRAESIHALA